MIINTNCGVEQDNLPYKGIQNNYSVYSRLEEMPLYLGEEVAFIKYQSKCPYPNRRKSLELAQVSRLVPLNKEVQPNIRIAILIS